MTIPTALIMKGLHSSYDPDFVPLTGEVIIDNATMLIKIGDGKTSVKDLPWVDYGNDSAKEESSLSIGAKSFIEDHINLIENNDYDTLYSHIATPALAQEITRALLKSDLNPKPYLSKIPQSIKHILEPEDVWAEDTSYLDTMRELQLKFDMLTTKLYSALGIPPNMIKVGN